MNAHATTDRAAIFDLDGVLVDTAQLHYQSWKLLADELGIPFDEKRNEALRGLSREESLAQMLGDRASEFSDAQQADLLRRKNDLYLQRVSQLAPQDAYRGVDELLAGLREREFRLAVASSSRNAAAVLQRLKLRDRFEVLVDGNTVREGKPDPRLFLHAAEQLSVLPARCIVIEDAASGVQAALAAGMAVIGLGPMDRVGQAHAVATGIEQLTADDVEHVWRRQQLAAVE